MGCAIVTLSDRGEIAPLIERGRSMVMRTNKFYKDDLEAVIMQMDFMRHSPLTDNVHLEMNVNGNSVQIFVKEGGEVSVSFTFEENDPYH